MKLTQLQLETFNEIAHGSVPYYFNAITNHQLYTKGGYGSNATPVHGINVKQLRKERADRKRTLQRRRYLYLQSKTMKFEYFTNREGRASVHCETAEGFSCGATELYNALNKLLTEREKERRANGSNDFNFSAKRWKQFKELCKPNTNPI